MPKLTPHFDSSEFAWPYPKSYNARLMAEQLEILRWALGGAPIRLGSAYRTPEQNRRAGGVKRSQHVYGTAVDFVVAGKRHTRWEIAQRIREGMKGGLLVPGGVGAYDSHIHWDLRGKIVFWDKTTHYLGY